MQNVYATFRSADNAEFVAPRAEMRKLRRIKLCIDETRTRKPPQALRHSRSRNKYQRGNLSRSAQVENRGKSFERSFKYGGGVSSGKRIFWCVESGRALSGAGRRAAS